MPVAYYNLLIFTKQPNHEERDILNHTLQPSRSIVVLVVGPVPTYTMHSLQQHCTHLSWLYLQSLGVVNEVIYYDLIHIAPRNAADCCGTTRQSHTCGGPWVGEESTSTLWKPFPVRMRFQKRRANGGWTPCWKKAGLYCGISRLWFRIVENSVSTF